LLLHAPLFFHFLCCEIEKSTKDLFSEFSVDFAQFWAVGAAALPHSGRAPKVEIGYGKVIQILLKDLNT
jgi:hypothetical protein